MIETIDRREMRRFEQMIEDRAEKYGKFSDICNELDNASVSASLLKDYADKDRIAVAQKYIDKAMEILEQERDKWA